MGQNVDIKKFLLSAVVFLVVLVFLGLAAMTEDSDPYDYVDYAANQLVNRVVESGLLSRDVNYDDPLLTQTRTIIITEEINEITS